MPAREERIQQIKGKFAGKTARDITLEDAILFSDVPFFDLMGIVNEQEKGRERYWHDFDLVSDEDKRICEKYLRSLPSETEVLEFARRHIEPLKLTEENGYKVEFGKPFLEGSGGLKKYTELSLPYSFHVEVRISAMRDGYRQELSADITVVLRNEQEAEDRFDIGVVTYSYLKDRGWVDAKLAEESTFYVIVGARNPKQAEALYNELFDRPDVVSVEGISSAGKRSIECAAAEEYSRQDVNSFIPTGSEEERMMMEEREEKLRNPNFPSYKAKPEKAEENRILNEGRHDTRETE